MTNELLINLVNKALGPGKRTSKGNVAYHCKFCNHLKPKLEVNFTENKEGKNPWNCWTCNTKGQTIKSLFKRLNILSENYTELSKLVKISPLKYIEKNEAITSLELPKEFTRIYDKPLKKYINYLLERGLTKIDILRYGIGYCDEGIYKNRIIIPSYDIDGKLTFFSARSIEKNTFNKYINPTVSRNIIPFEMMVNWNLPITICEGMLDAIAIKRNSIPLLGKTIQSKLMEKLVQSKVKEIYIALDKDAIKQSLSFCEKFLNEGKKVYLVELNGKDPSDIGFEEINSIINQTPPLTNRMLMEQKLELI